MPDKIKVYNPPASIKEWEDHLNENIGFTAFIAIAGGFAGFFVGTMIATISDPDEKGWSPIMTWFTLGGIILPLLYSVLMYVLLLWYRRSARDRIDTRTLNHPQKQTLDEYNSMPSHHQEVVKDLVLSTLTAEDSKDVDTLRSMFCKIHNQLSRRDELMRALSPNPAIEDARTLAQSITSMNEELQRTVNETRNT